MKYSEIMTALEQEDRTLLAILWINLIFLPFLILFPTVQENILAGSNNSDSIIATYEVGFLLALVVSMVILIISILYDLKASKRRLDEREQSHAYQVSRIGYITAIIGICVYAIPFKFLPEGNVLTGQGLPLLLLVIILVRLRRRIRLNKEN